MTRKSLAVNNKLQKHNFYIILLFYRKKFGWYYFLLYICNVHLNVMRD